MMCASCHMNTVCKQCDRERERDPHSAGCCSPLQESLRSNGLLVASGPELGSWAPLFVCWTWRPEGEEKFQGSAARRERAPPADSSRRFPLDLLGHGAQMERWAGTDGQSRHLTCRRTAEGCRLQSGDAKAAL